MELQRVAGAAAGSPSSARFGRNASNGVAEPAGVIP